MASSHPPLSITEVCRSTIHHKTGFTGPHGYPDPTYLTRVLDELAQFGIK